MKDNFDIGKLLDDIDLPTDDQIKKETQSLNYTNSNNSRYQNAEYKQKHANAIKEAVNTPQRKQKMRERHQRLLAEDPNYYSKWVGKNAEQAKDPAWQKAQREGLLKKFEDPQVRKNISDGVKKSWQNPERLQKQLAGIEKWKQNPNYAKVQAQRAQKAWKAIITEYGEFENVKEYEKSRLSDPLRPGWSDRKKQMPHLYYIKQDGPGKTTYEKVVYADGKQYQSVRQFTIDSGKGVYWFQQMCKKYPDRYFIKTEPRREWLLFRNDPK